MPAVSGSSQWDVWREKIHRAGINGESLVSSHFSNAGIRGSGEAHVRLDGVKLMFLLERGEEFVDIGPQDGSAELFRFDDLWVALGWRESAVAAARKKPAALDDELRELATRLPEVRKALSPSDIERTRGLVREVAAQRERSFVQKLKDLAGR
jgi:hypothetical protein